jgi:predicted secreted protein
MSELVPGVTYHIFNENGINLCVPGNPWRSHTFYAWQLKTSVQSQIYHRRFSRYFVSAPEALIGCRTTYLWKYRRNCHTVIHYIPAKG